MTTVTATPAAGSQRHDRTRGPRRTRNTTADSTAQASGGIRRNDSPAKATMPSSEPPMSRR